MRVLVLLMLVAAVVGGACGSSNGSTPTPTPTAKAPLPTPFPQPTITGTRVTAPAKGYAVDIPPSWKARPNYFASAGVTNDVFFAPETQANVTPNITVACEPPGEAATLDARVKAEQTVTANRPGFSLQSSTPDEVAGKTAVRDVFDTTAQGQAQSDPRIAIQRVDVRFDGDVCSYTVSLVAPGGGLDPLLPTFDTFLKSFVLIPKS